jgi:hypothetical protein
VKRNQRLVHRLATLARMIVGGGGKEHSSAVYFLIHIQESDDLDIGVYHPRGIALPGVD